MKNCDCSGFRKPSYDDIVWRSFNVIPSLKIISNPIGVVQMNDDNPINMEELFEIMDDDNELIKECFAEFISSAPAMLERVKNAVESEDAQGLQSYAHKIKGSLRYLAAERAADLAYDLEKMGIEGKLGNADIKYRDLAMECEKLKKVMSNFET
jgi:HPt (histidine-containing phosphotransfer) domain-containing protein